MALLDILSARASAIVTGAYPVAPEDPYITAGTFSATPVMMPMENADFPGGTLKAAANRRFDFVWERLAFDPPGSENSAQGPWVRDARLLVRVQYEVVRPNRLAPPAVDLTLGALELATRRALNDAAVIQWAFLRPGAWSGVAIGALLDQDVTAEKVDALRVVATTRVRFLLSQLITSSPGLWT